MTTVHVPNNVLLNVQLFLVYLHTLVPKVFVQINETCCLVRHLSIHGIKCADHETRGLLKTG